MLMRWADVEPAVWGFCRDLRCDGSLKSVLKGAFEVEAGVEVGWC